MARPWMPLYVADYLADTGHLSTVQHGAYLLLIMHYWRTGGLPDDDGKLSKIVRLPREIWARDVRPTVEELFGEGWSHKRIDSELQKSAAISFKRGLAGKRGGRITAINRFVKKNSNGFNATRPAIATQLSSKGVAVTTTIESSLTSTEQGAEEKGLSELEKIVRAKGWTK